VTPVEELEALLKAEAKYLARNKIASLYADQATRDKYSRHMAFFALGRKYKTRAFIAANRVGKTLGGGGYETTLHLTGDYPAWWHGHRFERPVDWWAAGDTKETVRDIIQTKLVGPETARGTGLIPADCLGKIRLRTNGNGAIDTVEVLHKPTKRWSLLGFKSYDQGRTSFQGTEKDGIWLDEESDEGIRAECALRLMTTGGLLIETFTPLKGLTPIVTKYMEGGDLSENQIIEGEDRAVVMAGWDDVPHLGAEEKARMLAESEPHLRDDRRASPVWVPGRSIRCSRKTSWSTTSPFRPTGLAPTAWTWAGRRLQPFGARWIATPTRSTCTPSTTAGRPSQ
jgi:phage terminase large subunit-like protein